MDNNRPIYWECKTNGHDKFWVAHIITRKESASYSNYTDADKILKGLESVERYVLIRRWGLIGTQGQTMEQSFDDIYDAEKTLDRLIWDKENKGYKPVF